MAKPTAQQCYAMISHYEKGYLRKYKKKPVVNRYSARYGFDAVLTDLGTEDTKALIDYYFTCDSDKSHPLTWFFYNYDTLLVGKRDHDKDVALRKKLREESKIRAEEWRARGYSGIADN